jgi:hypothetical protein
MTQAKTRLFRRMETRDGIQCRERRRASSYTTAKGSYRARTAEANQSTGNLLQQEDIRSTGHAGSITATGEVDAKIMVTSLDTQLRMVSSDGTKILSLHLVKAHCRVYDSDEDEHAAFHMTREHDGSVRHFRPSVSGLYY